MKKSISIFLSLILALSIFIYVGNVLRVKNTDAEQDAFKSGTITAVLNGNDEYVFLTNDEMTEWLKNYSYSSSQKYSGYGDHFYPKNSVTVSWADSDNSEYYSLFFSKNKDMSNSTSYLLTEKSKTFTDLLVATDYYWRVASYKNGTQNAMSKVFHFTTTSTPKTITIEGVSNTRDIGGYMTTFGKQVKQGLVYRCGAPEGITAKGKDQAINVYGIKTELDLRGAFPFQRRQGELAEQALIDYCVENGSSFAHYKDEVKYIWFWTPSYTVAPTGLNDFYGNNEAGEYDPIKDIDTDHQNDYQFIKVMRTFANPDNYPIIFHCAAGRDRTGLVGCTLNALLGVCDEDLHIDYETSFFSQSGSADDSYVPSFVSNFESILGYFYTFKGDTLAEKVANYLMTYGMTEQEIASIRSIMLG